MSRSLTLAIALFAAVAPACSGAATLAPDPIHIGPPRYHLEIRGRTITLHRGETILLTLAEDAFSAGVVETLDDAASYDPWAIEQRGDEEAGVTFRAARDFRVEASGPDFAAIALDFGDGVRARVDVGDAADGAFTFDVRPEPSPEGAPVVALLRVRARTSNDPAEGFYGLGEWQDTVDHRGKLRAMQMEADLEIESANNEAHVPVPFLLGTKGWAMFVASRRVGAFDVARKDPGVVEATFAVSPPAERRDAEALRVWLFGADAPIDLMKACYRVSGSVRLPPPWALGPWIWRDENETQAEVEVDVATLRRLDLATSAIWIDRPYASAVNTFDFDPAKFPDPEGMIAKVRAAGLRLALWSTPYLESAAQPMRADADARRLFPPQSGIPLNKWSSPIDFTNPEAFAFWRDLASRYTRMGIDGFKLDYGEDVVPSIGLVRSVWRFADGSDERTMHHGYSGLYHRAYAEALPEERFLLCRAAHWGEQSNGCVIWPGDMDATFTRHRERFVTRDGSEVLGVGGLPATVVMGLTLGVSGFPFFGADTGGYRHSPPDEELFIRWTQQTALSTVMQVGDSSSQPPWVFTPENGRSDATVDVYRTYARLHLRLFPYEWTFAQQIPIDGKPIQRPLGLVYPEMGLHPSDVYMFGDDLLVAPVLDRGARVRELVPPAGTWFEWWDGAQHVADGKSRVAIDAPLEKLPLLMREGAIVPLLRPSIDTLTETDDPAIESYARDPGVLWARVAPGRPRRFALWDETAIERAPDGALVATAGAVFTRGFVLELIATPEPRDVVRDDPAGGPKTTLERRADLAALEAAPDGWAWSPDRRGTLWIKLASSGRVVAR
ncbi:MAG: glycoside hydrolase family 31 protein [Labilithrix sp.]|nr:glycoside hydrolase family 31 protein [Labilithrix sp.]